MACCSLSWVVVPIALWVVYKLVDLVLRWPRVGRLSARYIVVTGCDTGFGNEIARRLDSLGCHVFAGCLTEKGEVELRKACSERLTTMSLDVANPDSVRRAFNTVKDKLPPRQGLWGVLNNAGIMGRIGREEWLNIDNYKQVLDVNLLGLIDVTMTFLPLVKQARGRIVNTSSIVGRFVIPGGAPYNISKHGVEGFTDGLRRTLRDYGCKAVLIEPGFHQTHLMSEANVKPLLMASWNQASPEVQEEFGKEFFDRLLRIALEKNTQLCSPRLSDVVDAYEHALLAWCPRVRYVVGKDARYFWIPMQSLPEWLSDWIFRALSKERNVPAAMKKRYIP